MVRIFITGSSDGLGLRAAQALSQRGHEVYLHARTPQRATEARSSCPSAKDVFIADLSSTSETQSLATQLNTSGPWDTIIHNAGVMHGASAQGKGKEGLPKLFAVNTLAPYILTSLVDPPPKRYVFVASGMHHGGDATLRDVQSATYSDSKLHNVLLAFWFARRFAGKGVTSNALNPGWVPTKMGGSGAPDDINASIETYVMLAEGSGVSEGKTGKFWYQSREARSGGSGRETSYTTKADEAARQDKLIEILEKISGVQPPE
ncbi:NAD(P)-binding protein [Hypoxylon trugodes]|uniref:NAD(P)-binding protein n=1 Tax=Hypoxylon trugodes TaxID=326681 RepID=UPI002196DD93|nr:NAD(P)-binding protein [Hypoxylon trugodes]KAI1389004.1 NAD(P)-binding protein [Hypoxylon trugodes]